MPKVSVILTTCNRAELFTETLDSLLVQTYPTEDFEILILDNGSRDDTPAVARSYIARNPGPPFIRYVREDRPGLLYARIRAAREMTGDIYAQIEDDAVADRNWLTELVGPLQDPGVGLTGGKVLPDWESEPPEWIIPFQTYLTAWDMGHEVHENYVTGCSLAVWRDVLFEVGGFNPDVFGAVWLGNGEVGLQNKVRKAGYKTLYVPSAVVHHYVPSSRLTLDYMRRRFVNEASSSVMSYYQAEHPTRMQLLRRACHTAVDAAQSKITAWRRKHFKDHAYYYYELTGCQQWKEALCYLRLVYDSAFRRYVGRQDWLSRPVVAADVPLDVREKKVLR